MRYEIAMKEHFKVLVKTDNLEELASAVMSKHRSFQPPFLFKGRDFFRRWDFKSLILSFQTARSGVKSIVLMCAIRGKEEGITKQMTTARKKREKVEVQRQCRLTYPEIAWHGHGFQDDCPCVDCAGTYKT